MKFKTKPYKHQLEAYELHKDDEYFALFCEMGVGKSKIAIDIASYKYEQGTIDSVLIIAPNHVHSRWITEQYPEHCSIPYKSFVWNSGKSKTVIYNNMIEEFLTPKWPKLKVFSINVEAFQSKSIIPYIVAYMKTNKVFTIVDEATRVKTPTAVRSKTIHKLEKYGQRCILTGTPVTKSPFGLWSMFEFLHHDYFGCNFFMFQNRHGVMCQGVNERTGGRYKTLIDERTWAIALSQLKKMDTERGTAGLMPDDFEAVAVGLGLSEKNVKFIWKQQAFKKFKRLDELKKAIDPVTFYAKKEDCLDLPEKIYDTITIEMSKEHRKVYNTLKSKLLVEYEGKDLTVVNKVALTTRLMQLAGGYFPYTETREVEVGTSNAEKSYSSASHTNTVVIKKKASLLIGKKNVKIERIREELEEISHFPIIIWARFINELEALYAEFKKDYRCALYYGATPPHTREAIIEDFKEGKYDIFIGNPSVAGFGLNLQEATTQFYYSNGFNVEERLQAEDRSHRIGVKRPCVYKDIVFLNSIDEKITMAILSGREMNDYFKAKSLREILED